MSKNVFGRLWTFFGIEKIFGVYTHFRPSENSAIGVFSRKNCYFCKFLAVSVKHPNGFLQDTLQVLRAQGSKKVVKCQKVSAHTRHTHFETSAYSVFLVHKRQHFDEKCCVFVPCGCKYWFGAHPNVLAEKFGARRWFYIPWTLFNDQNSCLQNSLNLDTFQVFWEFWDSVHFFFGLTYLRFF